MKWFKKHGKSILLALSLVLNALGGTGVIPPVVTQKLPPILDAAGSLFPSE
jgi:hypothetical protein